MLLRRGYYDRPSVRVPGLKGPRYGRVAGQRPHPPGLVGYGHVGLADAHLALEVRFGCHFRADVHPVQAGGVGDLLLEGRCAAPARVLHQDLRDVVAHLLAVDGERLLVHPAGPDPPGLQGGPAPGGDEPGFEIGIPKEMEVGCIDPAVGHCLGDHPLRHARDLMVIDRGVHQRAGHHQALRGGDAAPVEDDAVVHHGHRLDEPVAVYPAVAHARVERVPHEIVHLIRINGTVDDLMGVVLRWEVLVPVPEAVQGLLAGRFRRRYQPAHLLGGYPLGLHRLGEGVHASEDVRVLLATERDVPEHEGPGEVHMPHARGLLHRLLEGMRERRVAHVVQQPRHADRAGIVAVQADGVGHAPGEMVRAEAVLETRVIGAGEHQIPQSELLDAPEPLHLGAVQDLEEHALDADRAMDRVLDHLGCQITHRSSRACLRRSGSS